MANEIAKFADRSITAAELDNTVEQVGNFAFYGCQQLSSVTFPNRPWQVVESGVTSYKSATIGYQSFYYCTSLTSIAIPWCSNIGYGAFAGCSNLQSVYFNLDTTDPDAGYYYYNSRTIGQYAFYGCTSLTSFVLPYYTTIQGDAFEGCTGLTSIEFYEGCNVIPNSNNNYILQGLTGLQSMTINDSSKVSWFSRYLMNASTGPNNSFLVYVPSNLVTSYKNTSGLTTAQKDRIRAIPS